jgi:hypothetical protein
MVLKYLNLTDFTNLRGLEPSGTTTPNEDQVSNFIAIAEKDFEDKVGNYGLQSGIDVVTKGLAHGVTLEEPNLTINSIHISNGDLITPTWSLVPTTDYKLDKYSRILLRNPIVNREYKVNVDCGYSLSEVPIEVKYLVYLLTMSRIFNAHLFVNNVSDNVTRIVDVEVYKQITKGGNAFQGLGAMKVVVDEQFGVVKGKLRSRLG